MKSSGGTTVASQGECPRDGASETRHQCYEGYVGQVALISVVPTARHQLRELLHRFGAISSADLQARALRDPRGIPLSRNPNPPDIFRKQPVRAPQISGNLVLPRKSKYRPNGSFRYFVIVRPRVSPTKATWTAVPGVPGFAPPRRTLRRLPGRNIRSGQELL